MSAERQLNPSRLSQEEINAIAFAVAGVLAKHGKFSEEPLDSEGAAAFLKISQSSLRKMKERGKIKAHYPGGLDIPLYYPSELNKAVKEKEVLNRN